MIADRRFFEMMLSHRGYDEVDAYFVETLTGDEARAWREYKARYVVEVEPMPALHDWTQLDMIEALHGDPLNTPFQLYCATEIVERAARYHCHIHVQPDENRKDAWAWPPGVFSWVHKTGSLRNTLPEWVEFVRDALGIETYGTYMCPSAGRVQHVTYERMESVARAAMRAESKGYKVGSHCMTAARVQDAMVYVSDKYVSTDTARMHQGLYSNPIDGVLVASNDPLASLVTHRHLNSDRCPLRDVQGFDWRGAWL